MTAIPSEYGVIVSATVKSRISELLRIFKSEYSINIAESARQPVNNMAAVQTVSTIFFFMLFSFFF